MQPADRRAGKIQRPTSLAYNIALLRPSPLRPHLSAHPAQFPSERPEAAWWGRQVTTRQPGRFGRHGDCGWVDRFRLAGDGEQGERGQGAGEMGGCDQGIGLVL